VPLFEAGRIILPPKRHRTLYDRSTVNLIDAFVEEEYMAFPGAAHDDMLDCLARIEDPELKVRWPNRRPTVASTAAAASNTAMSATRT
jgi:hypothetical protein